MKPNTALRDSIADIVKTVSDNLGADRMGETMANDVADEILALIQDNQEPKIELKTQQDRDDWDRAQFETENQ